MATVNVVLRTDKKPDKENKFPVYIRVHYKKPIYYYTGIRVREEDWNYRSDTVRASEDKYAVYNSIIDEEYTRVDNAIIELTRRGKDPSVKEVKNAVQKNNDSDSDKDFIEYAREFIENKKKEVKNATAKNYYNSLDSLVDFAGDFLPFKDIDVSMLKRYNRYLLVDRENKKTTAYIRLLFVKQVYKEAIKDGYADQSDNPFFIYEIEMGKTRDPVHLNLDEINRISSLDIESGSYLWHVRNGFLFSFWCAGIRISDLCRLDWVDNIIDWHTDQPAIDYIMGKNGKRRVFPLLPPAVDILRHYEPKVKKINSTNYIFPFIENVITNKKNKSETELIDNVTTKNNYTYLPKLKKMAGIKKKITNHTSRHSFAACFEELELPVEALQELLAHSNMKTTESYRKKLGVAVTKRSRKSLNKFFDRYKKAQDVI